MKTIPQTDSDNQPTKIGEWVRDSTTHSVPVWITTGREVSEIADLDDEIEIEIDSTEIDSGAYKDRDARVDEVWLPLDLLAHILRANGYTVSKP